MNNFTYLYGFTNYSYFTGKYVSDYNEANIHLDLYNKIHTAMVNEINDYKRVNGKSPENMQIIYNYLHEIEMDLFNDIKAKLK